MASPGVAGFQPAWRSTCYAFIVPAAAMDTTMKSDGCRNAPEELSTSGRRANPISPGLHGQVVKFAQLRFDLLPQLIGIVAIAAVLIPILVATLYPFEWVPPRTHNAAAYQRGGGLEFPDMGIARTAGPPPWLAEAIKTHKLEIALDVDAVSDHQQSPARILSLSQDIHHRNLTIDQQSRDLSIRLRTPDADESGMPPITIPGVFGQPGWVEIRLRIEPGRLMIWINGEVRINHELPEAPLKTWNSSYQLALGNEFTGDQSWLGKIGRALVTTGGTRVDYAVPGALEVPVHYWFFQRRFNFVPLQASRRDYLNNLLLFIPLGFVLGLVARRNGWKSNCKIIVFASSISTIIEVLQLGIPGRYPSLNDILFNTGGSILGLVLARWLVRNSRSNPFT